MALEASMKDIAKDVKLSAKVRRKLFSRMYDAEEGAAMTWLGFDSIGSLCLRVTLGWVGLG